MLTAAQKREARRARVLQSSESRLNMLKGSIASQEPPSAINEPSSLEQRVDEGVEELVASCGEAAVPQSELQFPPRVDPLQRRRDAANRRLQKEKMVTEMLNNKALNTEGEEHEWPTKLATTSSCVAKPTFNRHAIALKLRVLEERVIIYLLVAAAAFIAMSMDIRSIIANLAGPDHLVVTYQDLLSKGMSIASIRQHIEREQVDPDTRRNLEHFVTQQEGVHAMETTKTSSFTWLPGMTDLGTFFTALVDHPPILLGVVLVRVLIAAAVKGLESALDLPDVKNPQEGNLGFVANMVFMSHPTLKELFVKGRKSFDDVSVFLFLLVVFVAIRVIWLS
ncbi:hypothetical protein CCR75_006971 [Bremia lactucae]|uniref:Uncharacterized protein n=1 Tax=Bremia lactucae TaxID=4779 RepID=A0A976FLK3_BRELC|nr:hypothetical protein CCR75_006971 [Bremia lactucae]